MSHVQTPPPHAPPADRWGLVVAAPMRAEAKLAWLYLWGLAGEAAGTIATSYAAVAVAQGTTERSGRRAVATLADRGLVRVIDRQAATVRILIWDPLEVILGRDRTAEPRPLLDVIERQPSPAPAAEPEPPRIRGGSAADPPAPTFDSKSIYNLQTFEPLEPLKVGTPPTRSAADPPRQAGPAGPLANASAAALGRALDRADTPGRAEAIRAAAVRRLVAEICRRVADPALRDAPARRVAEAVAAGQLPAKELEGILTALEKARRGQTLKGAPWWYFVGAAQKAFGRHALTWPKTAQHANT